MKTSFDLFFLRSNQTVVKERLTLFVKILKRFPLSSVKLSNLKKNIYFIIYYNILRFSLFFNPIMYLSYIRINTNVKLMSTSITPRYYTNLFAIKYQRTTGIALNDFISLYNNILLYLTL